MKVKILNNKYNNQEVEACIQGYYSKRWIERGDFRFLAKLNENEETNENFGEVLYSHIAKRIGLNCVESVLANIEIIDKKLFKNSDAYMPTNNGVIIKNFLPSGAVDISVEEMLNDYYKSINFNALLEGKESPYLDLQLSPDLSPFMSVTNAEDYLKVVEAYANAHNYKIDMEKTRIETYKYLILDWFLMQEDRSKANLAFILQDNELTLAPCFDNGRCLVFYENAGDLCVNLDMVEARRKIMPFEVDVTKLPEKTKTLEDVDYYSYDIANDIASMQRIYSEAKSNPEIKAFVDSVTGIDIEKELETLNTLAEWEGCTPLSSQAVKVCKYYFDYKVTNYKKFQSYKDNTQEKEREM